MNAQNKIQNMYNSPELAKKIKLVAKDKGVTVKQMLEDCSIGSNAISHLLHGKSMGFDTLARISDYLDVSIDYLLGRTSNPLAHKEEKNEKN